MRAQSCQVNVGQSERLLSMGAGGFLTGWGLRHLLSGSGLLATAAGAALIYRGMTGHCAFYAAMEDQEGSSRAGFSKAGARRAESFRSDPVDEADVESFPASDAPSWTGATVGRTHNPQSEQPS